MQGWPQRWSDLRATLHSSSPRTSDVAVGCLDELGLVLEHGMPRGWFARGWTAFERGWSSLGELTLVVRGPECSFVGALSREPRDDVMHAYGDPSYRHSGFRVFIPYEPLADGEYRLAFEARTGERNAIFETGTTLHVREGRPWLAAAERRAPLLHVVHVPKTGGTSFGHLLQQSFGDGLVHHYGARVLLRAGARCIQGHNYASDFLRYAPDLRLAMWFRDPIERVISEYFHWRRNPDTHPLDGEDLATFARRPTMVNVHRRCMDGVPLSRLDYVGISEYFDASIALFCRMFELPLPKLAPLNINPDKSPGAAYDLPLALRAEIELNHRADIQLHAQAKQRFAALCRAYDVPIKA